MRKYPFTVIYIDENNKLRHKQIRDYSAVCACYTFQELYPKVEVLEAGLGSINKESWNKFVKSTDTSKPLEEKKMRGGE